MTQFKAKTEGEVDLLPAIRDFIATANKAELIRKLALCHNLLSEVEIDYILGHIGETKDWFDANIHRIQGLLTLSKESKRKTEVENGLIKKLEEMGCALILHQFAIDVARKSLWEAEMKGRNIDGSMWAIIKAKRKWMRGHITTEELRRIKEEGRRKDSSFSASMAAQWAGLQYAKPSAKWAAFWGATTAHFLWDNQSPNNSRALEKKWQCLHLSSLLQEWALCRSKHE